MKFFVHTTKSHQILGGRKNFESFGKVLPRRTNLILTRDRAYEFEGANIFHDLEKAVDFAKKNGEEELMVIGGGEVYRQVLPFTDRIYLTRIHAEIDGHTYFEVDETKWKVLEKSHHPKDDRHAFDFTFYTLERPE
jgi:dihydrofolate reductase